MTHVVKLKQGKSIKEKMKTLRTTSNRPSIIDIDGTNIIDIDQPTITKCQMMFDEFMEFMKLNIENENDTIKIDIGENQSEVITTTFKKLNDEIPSCSIIDATNNHDVYSFPYSLISTDIENHKITKDDFEIMVYSYSVSHFLKITVLSKSDAVDALIDNIRELNKVKHLYKGGHSYNGK